MAHKLNCWEFFNCTRGPMGPDEMCRVVVERSLDGANGGTNAGRVCWAVAGSMAIDSAERADRGACSKCEFRHSVVRDELPDLVDCVHVYERLGYADTLALTIRGECDVECHVECPMAVSSDV